MTDTELTKMLRSSANRVVTYAADRIEALTAERDGLLRCVTDNHVALCRAESAEAERDRLRALLSEADRRIVWEAHGFGNDFAERVEAALKGETNE